MNAIRDQLYLLLLPVVDQFRREVANALTERIAKDLDRVGEALELALSAYADGTTEDASDVQDEKPVRDRKVARAAVQAPRSRRKPRGERARADRSDGAPAVPAEVASAPSSATRKAAIAEAVTKREYRCGNCRGTGHRATACPVGDVVERDVKPSNATVEAPPPPRRIGSRESKPLPPRAEAPANDDEEGPRVELLVTDAPRRGRRYVSRRTRGFARAFVVTEKVSDKRAGERLGLDRVGSLELDVLEAERPRTRGECRDGMRPCPFVGCKHHLYLDVTDAGSLKIRFPGVEPTDLAETCSLDVADRGGATLETIAEITNLTRERIRQVEMKGLHAMKAAAVEDGMEPADSYFPHPKED